MDDTRFDALTKRFAAPATRRAALRLLAAGLLGGLLPARGAAFPAAACGQVGAGCASDADCCVGYCGQDPICACVPDGGYRYPSGTGGCCNGQPANADGYCGVCRMDGVRCTTDGECCQGRLCCFNGTVLDTVCTEVYSTGGFCPGDVVQPPPLPPGSVPLGDVNSGPNEGGAIGVGDASGDVIVDGDAPVPTGCPTGQTPCGGSCVDLASDEFHCGACFAPCPLGGYCQGGVCDGLICQDPLVACFGRCVDLDWDWQNCGACGEGCFEGAECVGGACVED